MLTRVIIFLLLNFAALAIGGLFTSKGVPSDWYAELNKAPWTPPGWVFGFAWTSIMICFSFYLAYLWPKTNNKDLLITLFVIQWILNVAWNPTFFYYHQILLGLLLISTLTLLIAYFKVHYWPKLNLRSLLILPYFLWLIIATSLNAFIFFKN